MKYLVEESLHDFQAWSGGKDTLNELKDMDVENPGMDFVDQVETLIEEAFEGTIPTEVQINDFLWFERDYIMSYLGFTNED